jgi:membrane protease YdiL (CAAX protease family)
MQYASTPPPPPLAHAPTEPAEPIAHWTHTLGLILFLLLSATFAHQRVAEANPAGSPLLRYVSTLTLEWLLLGSVIAGIYHRRAFFQNAFVHRERSWAESVGLGVAVYCTGFITIAIIGSALYFTPLFHRHNEDVILAMLPHTVFQFAVWFLVSLTAGICEEVIFRGYLQQQFTAWTRRPILSIVAAGALFGCLHVYEGLGAIVPLAALGILFGFVVRQLKGDLRTVIVAHTLQDFLVALIALARPFVLRHQPHS